jgi:hypothetical protein
MISIFGALLYMIAGTINSGIQKSTAVYFLKINDTLQLSVSSDSSEKYYWYNISQEKKIYEFSEAREYADIAYKSTLLTSGSNLLDVSKYIHDPGTYYIACASNDTALPDTFSEILPINFLYLNKIIQIVIREDDSYLGYLTELLNTPFILPPMSIPTNGHQTDLRMGSDCAELAIYGKRRQGYNIPYCGPVNIIKFLDTISDNKIFPGCLIHFGDQVSVVYKDAGISEVLDKDDLLIQSYTNGVEIISWEKSQFYKRKYFVFKWKNDYE